MSGNCYRLIRMLWQPAILLFCLLSFNLSCVQAQSGVDSLQLILMSNPHDTLKVDIHLALHRKLHDDSARSMQYLTDAIELSQKIQDSKRLSKAYLALARVHDYAGNLSGAKEALAKVQGQIKYIHDAKIEANFYYHIGIVDYFEGVYNDAVTNLFKAVRLYEVLEDSAGVAGCYLNIGTCYKELGNNDKALQYYLTSLSLYESSGNGEGAAMAYGNLGNIYRRNGEHDKALSYFNRSLLFNQKNNRKDDERIDLNNIGDLFLDKGEYQTALSYFKRSEEVSKTLGLERGIQLADFNIAAVQLKLGNYITAVQMLQGVLKKAKELNYRDLIMNANELLSTVHEEMGQFESSLKYRKEFETWKDSLINENHLNQVKELDLKYETEKKDKRIQLFAKETALQQKEVERQSTLKKGFIAGFILVIILIVLVAYTFRQRLHNQKVLAAKNAEISDINFKHQISELEMKALRAQINPHFLFNCMNSINKMILNGETDRASLYLTKFSKLVRLILENAEAPKVSLESELALVESYIQLEELRFKGKIDYHISVDESIEKESTYLPSMVLQPFVENAIWHGLMHKKNDQKGVINIEIKEEEERLHCTIEDNGVGREASQHLRDNSLIKNKSMGMKITEERLRLLSQERLEQLIHITDLKDALNHALGTRVEINIPLI